MILQPGVIFRSLESDLEVQTRCTLCAKRDQYWIMKSGKISALEMVDSSKYLQQLLTQGRQQGSLQVDVRS